MRTASPLSDAVTLRGVVLSGLSMILGATLVFGGPEKSAFTFDFGPGTVAPGALQVLPNTLYSPERGYGFERGSPVAGVERGGDDPLRDGFCTSDQPFFFSV